MPKIVSILSRFGDAGYIFYQLRWFDKSIEYFSRALKLSKQITIKH